jgi:dihydroneopterin aldolase
MRTLTIERLRVFASVGILEHELRAQQPLLMTLSVDLPQAPVLPPADRVDHVLDYGHLRSIAKEEAERAHVNMLETLAGRIVNRLLELPGVRVARVSVVKPSIFADCDGVSVAVTAERPA